MKSLKRLSLLFGSLLALAALAWASPYEGATYQEIKGRVEAINWQAGYMVVNGQKLALSSMVQYEYGRPMVGSYVEVKVRGQQGQQVVYKVEMKTRSGKEIRTLERSRVGKGN
ncbi:MAG: hypothetical protein KatS3mg074_524 [Meiothermus sp.]|uniref:DUF5666 domain-containing protein n=2 Tax=Meiothermus hypogaeus TaxID=884155 RepID=A0A511R311_9DEIN|nr:hypothetical protein [Meiothermus hypogaeus]RIH77816.1 hypothetical protein Mhypo_01846 [Meiothermus hypogaeus]GEM83991.1 hypothetical protein MHY01S_21570 [Meiothermus hypogaeus NBRC 106114]GIW38126.1 MAG: hypothetical protein KatS3mg074_524 [Meiothermus sp.]